MRLLYLSGTRADFGLFKICLQQLKKAGHEVAVIVTGTHLDESYGDSIDEIESSGIDICERIPVPCDSLLGSIGESLSIQVKRVGEVLQSYQADALIVLGDRGEMLMGAVAAIHQNVPVIHIHGGELSGTIDESIRHAISKLSHIHFTATSSSRERLLQMGESPDVVFCVGAPGLDGLNKVDGKCAWSRFGFSSDRLNGIIVFHPVVQDADSMGLQMKEVLDGAFKLLDGKLVILPNSDHGRKGIHSECLRVADRQNCKVVANLERRDYLSLLASADLMIGNSSSGIIEAASFGVPVVNVGDRQNFREQSLNTFNCDPISEEILNAGKLALEWAKSNEWERYNVYGDGNASARIVEVLNELESVKHLLKKEWYSL